MSLSKVPKTVINRIRQSFFNFLWAGKKESAVFHLAKREVLSQPKTCGGWGFKNLHWFGTTLAIKNTWRVITGTCIWSSLIADMYLKNKPFSERIWLVEPSSFKGGSNIRSALVAGVPWIKRWQVWILDMMVTI